MRELRYSFMSFSCPELDLDGMLAAAKRLGYDGIEPRLSAGHHHGIETSSTPAQRSEARIKAQDSSVAICCLATSCRYADPASAVANIEETHRCIDLAADVGAPSLRVFGGKLGEGLSRKDAIDLLVDSLRALAPQAQEAGVTLCVETHDDWCDPAHLAEVMRRVDRPSIAVNWDIMHPVRMSHATMREAYETLKPWIKHVHFHDGRQTGSRLEYLPIGQGDIDHRVAVHLLRTGSYQGLLSGEWIGWEPWEEHLPRELTTMKWYESEV